MTVTLLECFVNTLNNNALINDDDDDDDADYYYHRLNGSSSPVLTATCLSYGSFCDFLTFFPQLTWKSHPSTDFDAKWLK